MINYQTSSGYVHVPKKLENDELNYRTYNGYLTLSKKENEFNVGVEIDLIDEKVNRNNWQFMSPEEHRSLFAGIPILIAYPNDGKQIGDGHNFEEKIDAKGERYVSFTGADSERIIGSLSDDDTDIRIENRDGNKWIVGKGTIWSWYSHEATEKLAKQGRMSVSIEALVTDSHMEGDVEIEERYIPLGVTILGDGVPPAVASAEIRKLSFNDAFQKLKLKAASYQSKQSTEPKDQNKKGVNHHMLTSKQRDQIKSLFKEHQVMCMTDDGKSVLLCNSQDLTDISGYTFSDDNPNMILESGFGAIEAEVNVKFNSDQTAKIPLDVFLKDTFSKTNAANKALTAELSQKTEELKKLEEEVEAMKKAERKHRIESAKEAVQAAFAEMNATLSDDEKMNETILNEVIEEVENGKYCDVVNENGEYCGNKAAVDSINARAMGHLTEARKKLAENKRQVLGWNNGLTNNADNGDDIGQLLSRMGVQHN